MSWLLLAACETVCAFLFPNAVGRDVLLSLRVRQHLVARELTLLLIPAAVQAGVLLLLALLARRYARTAARWRAALCVLAAGTTVLMFFVYVAAWCTFEFVGGFPDIRAMLMLANDSVQLVQHAVHMDRSGVIAAVAWSLLTAAGWVALLLLVCRARPSVRTGINLLAASAIAASLWLAEATPTSVASGNKRVVDPTAGIDTQMGDFLAEAEGVRTGPLLRIRASLSEKSRTPTRAKGLEALARCRMSPLLPLASYVRGVDASRVRKLNVILIEIESLRTDQLVSFGGRRSVMPVVDALAASGRIFTRHYTLSSHSNYADIPPLSSHYPLRSAWYHVYPADPPYPRVLVYDLLHALGYRTAIVSSQNENWGGMANYLRTPGLDDFLHSANFSGNTYVPRGDVGFASFAGRNRRSGKVDDRATIDRAMEWLDRLAPDQPFFMYMNLQNSHVPYTTPASFDAPFPRPGPDLSIRFNSIPARRVREVKDAYGNSLAYIDSQIARLFEHLRKMGRWDDTVFVIGGDNGEAFLEHGFAAHASALFDEVVHTPVILRAPGLQPGVDDRLAATLDIPPTILDLLGLPPHPGFQGRSLLGPAPSEARSVFLVAQTPLAHQYAIVRDGNKLIEDQRSGAVLLFDLMADPGETRNLARSRPQVVEDLSRRLDLWITAQLAYYGDPTIYCCAYPPNVPD